MTCGHTKVEAIVNGVLGPYSVKSISNQTNCVSFIGISTDASNHNSVKMFPVLIQYFDFKKGGMQIKLVDICSTDNETSETVTDLLCSVLEKLHLTQKCISFSGDNCNTNFGGINRAGQNNIFNRLKSKMNENLIGIGCPAHIINNAVQTSCDILPIDVESIVLKLFNHFNIYTVRVATLKEFCAFVDTNYQQLLYHSKTRWLSLFPAIERVLKMFQALKSYFLSENNPPFIIKSFFQNSFSEAYLYFVHSLMTVFHQNIERIERLDNSVIETLVILEDVIENLNNRLKSKFIPLKVRELLKKASEEGLERECEVFKKNMFFVYEKAVGYIENWIKPLEQFKCFKWMNLRDLEAKNWEIDILPCLNYLLEKGVNIDDSKFFDQYSLLKKFVTESFTVDQHNLPSHKKWFHYFQHCVSTECFSELLILCEFFFAVTAHNANVERIFSLISAQWTKERNRLTLDSIKGIIMTIFNFDMTCSEFYDFILLPENISILNEIQRSEKYQVFSL